jgi:hypothetical protein
MPCGDQVPFWLQTRRAGPSSSNPLSQVYSAIPPAATLSPVLPSLNWTELCAGAPGNPHVDKPANKYNILRIVENICFDANTTLDVLEPVTFFVQKCLLMKKVLNFEWFTEYEGHAQICFFFLFFGL